MKSKISNKTAVIKTQGTEEKILIVEGKNDKSFCESLLEKKDIRGIKVICSKGKHNLKKELPTIKKTSNLKSLAILRDADQSAESAFQSLCSALKNNNLPIPRQSGEFATNDSVKVGVFIVPDGKSKGMLESLCLSIIKQPEGKSIMECVESFEKCIKKLPQGEKSYKQPKNWEKARVRAFLSVMEEDTPSLGVATQKGYWNLDSEKLRPLSDFLHKL